MYNTTFFHDRKDAGHQLAQKLLKYKGRDPLVLALPRGGVPVGLEVAKILNAPLNVLVARKIGAPYNPEFGIGAIAEGNVVVWDEAMVRSFGLDKAELSDLIEKEKRELDRRVKLYRDGRKLPALSGKTVLIVDDGLATGVTAKAAIASIKLRKPKKTVLAVPVAAHDSVLEIKPMVDDLVFVHSVHDFVAVGLWYKKFDQTSDEEVLFHLRDNAFGG